MLGCFTWTWHTHTWFKLFYEAFVCMHMYSIVQVDFNQTKNLSWDSNGIDTGIHHKTYRCNPERADWLRLDHLSSIFPHFISLYWLQKAHDLIEARVYYSWIEAWPSSWNRYTCRWILFQYFTWLRSEFYHNFRVIRFTPTARVIVKISKIIFWHYF